MTDKTGIIVLAAGSSSRLGKSKQLLTFHGKILLANTIDEATLTEAKAIIVVTGANNSSIEEELDDSGVLIVFNPQWEQGMGSSLICGLKHLLLVYPNIENCIIAVCDQPYIETAVFTALLEQLKVSGAGIVASSYGGILGTPVLFTKKYFGELLKLSVKDGAKKLLHKFKDDVAAIQFEKGLIDIDTIEDYNELIKE